MSLRTGLTDAKGLYTDTDSYTGVTVTALSEFEPEVRFTDGPATGSTHTVSVHVVDPTQIVMAAGTGTTCFFIRDSATSVGTEFAESAGTSCDATAPPATWTTSWE